ncbi:Similar to REXO1L1: Exonuclease GOR (Pan troglodytes) [Cotesia congregata]|uniref:Similar to REXO1L1: Exonuclease GOR (Pan troglodytes) n=1 Tax=Cotesia congregata TaxID=51543 RepID=A0A8J2HTT4_COTCN|nr:Similar to REXO1L1: Exonuclease GOR (Pan troglodytes) [Cotesia congregata]
MILLENLEDVPRILENSVRVNTHVQLREMGDAVMKMFMGFGATDPMVLATIFLGVAVVIIGFILGRRSGSCENTSEPKSDGKIQEPDNQKPVNTNDRNIASNKRTKNKKRREAQQEFTHSWVVGTLKGHTGSVLDINFSSDDKFLASCAEDCSLLPKETLKDNEGEVGNGSAKSSPSSSHSSKKSSKKDPTTNRKKNSSRVNKSMVIRSCSSSISSHSNSSSMESVSSIKDQAALSRRQKKNRRANRDQNQVDLNDYHRFPYNDNCIKPTIYNYPFQYTSMYSESFVSPLMIARGIQNQEIDSGIHNHVNAVFQKNNAAYRHNYDLYNRSHYNSVQYSKYRECLEYMSHSALISKLKSLTHPTNYLQCLGYLFKKDLNSSSVSFLHTPHCELIQFFYSYSEEDRKKFNYRQRKYLNVNAKIFIPSGLSYKPKSCSSISNSVESSDFESESSSDSEKNSESSESSTSHQMDSNEKVDPMLLILNYFEKFNKNKEDTGERECARCTKKFYINPLTEVYVVKEKCIYHCKSEMDLSPISNSKVRKCCQRPRDSMGCMEADFHVWTGTKPGVNGPFYEYMCAQPLKNSKNRQMFDVIALDCEMCITSQGFEPTRLTIVQLDGSIVYDQFIKPEHKIIDYNTHYSGIREGDLVHAKTLQKVHQDLKKLIHADTIIIGHGLENDLRKLKIYHETVLDTAFIYPHKLGFPNKKKLKILAETELNRTIQSAEHYAYEDAKAAMDLALNKVLEDVAKRK